MLERKSDNHSISILSGSNISSLEFIYGDLFEKYEQDGSLKTKVLSYLNLSASKCVFYQVRTCDTN